MITRTASWDYEKPRQTVANAVCSQCGAPAQRCRIGEEILVICLAKRRPCTTLKFEAREVINLVEDFNFQNMTAPSPLEARLDILDAALYIEAHDHQAESDYAHTCGQPI